MGSIVNMQRVAGTPLKIGVYSGNMVTPGKSGGAIATKTSLNNKASTPIIHGSFDNKFIP